MIVTILKHRILLHAYSKLALKFTCLPTERHSFVLNLSSHVRISIPIRTAACLQHASQIVRQFIQSANREPSF